MDHTPNSAETLTNSTGSQPDSLIGQTLDERYLIKSKLGQGGVGAVYLACDQKLHEKLVVVKVLLENSLNNDWIVLKFNQEREALARVNHPGVVGILDTGELPDRKPYIVIEFVDGISLRNAIKANPEGMELERAATIIKQIGAALSAVHEKKIYHRDFKPENVMLRRLGTVDEQVKIVDFGVAKVKESLIAPSTITGSVTAGTIIYMSPEQLNGTKVTAASDIYSFAVVAYEMVTGRRPFNPDTIAHLAEMQRQGVRARPIDLRPRLSEEAQAIILKGLAFEPGARHQRADAFGDNLARALMNEGETLKDYQRPKVVVSPIPESVDPALPIPNTAPEVPEAKAIQAPDQKAQPIASSMAMQKSLSRNWFRRAAVLVLVLVVLAGGYFVIANRESLFRRGGNSNVTEPVAQRSLSYSLTVQKMRDGKPYKEPFASSGQEIFESGYKFRLNVWSVQPGYLYVFNEGADEKNRTILTIIFPTPITNKGAARLDANQNMQTNWNTFGGEPGTEHFWIVWSASPIAQLETAQKAAFGNEEGAVTDASTAEIVRDFLLKNSNPKPETTKNTITQQTDMHANGELLVKLVELAHR